MKRWSLLALIVLLVIVFADRLFLGSDVAQLQPVEVIRVSVQQEKITVETDTGELGEGSDLKEAFENLKEHAVGEIFLETADYLIVTAESEGLIEELSAYLRPTCYVCMESDPTDMEKAAQFLDAHKPGKTLLDCRSQKGKIPLLITEEGGMRLVS